MPAKLSDRTKELCMCCKLKPIAILLGLITDPSKAAVNESFASLMKLWNPIRLPAVVQLEHLLMFIRAWTRPLVIDG